MSIAEAFANSCEQQARWREIKAEEYPEDLRNQRSADALLAAATWARTAEDAEPRLSKLLPPDIAPDDFLVLGENANRIFSSFGFHYEEELDRWLGEVGAAQYDDDGEEES